MDLVAERARERTKKLIRSLIESKIVLKLKKNTEYIIKMKAPYNRKKNLQTRPNI